MSLATRAGDLFYTFRFLRMLTTSFEDTDAYKLGLIDENGNRIKSEKLDTPDRKSAFTTFHRLVFNIKKLMAKVPFGKSKLASYAAALFLIKENYGLSDKNIDKLLEASEVDTLDFLTEKTEWFLLEDKRLSPGVYRVYNDKVLNETLEDVVKAKDRIRIGNNAYPVGEIFGLDVYVAEHINTGKTLYITLGEIYK